MKPRAGESVSRWVSPLDRIAANSTRHFVARLPTCSPVSSFGAGDGIRTWERLRASLASESTRSVPSRSMVPGAGPSVCPVARWALPLRSHPCDGPKPRPALRFPFASPYPYQVPPALRSSGGFQLWSGRRDSNPRPSAWKADALPTELHPPVVSDPRSEPGNHSLSSPVPVPGPSFLSGGGGRI